MKKNNIFIDEVLSALESDFKDDEIRDNLSTIGITNTELPNVLREISEASLIGFNGLYFTHFREDVLLEVLKRLSVKIIKFNYDLKEEDDVIVSIIEKEGHATRFKFIGNALKGLGIENIVSGWPSMKKNNNNEAQTAEAVILKLDSNEDIKEYEVVLKFKSNAIDAMEFCQEFYRLHPQLKKHWELTRESKDNDNISEILERALKYEAMFLMNVDMFININPDMDNNIKDGSLVNPDIRYDANRAISHIRNNMVTKRRICNEHSERK